MEMFLHMKYVGDDEAGHVEAVLAAPNIPSMRQEYEGETYAEVIHQVFYEMGHKLIKDENTLIIDFKS